ncbi:MAG: SpoIID/LytB domain-containing protein [Candidatus Omnitrophica bacterium]|nr:SpoIID/LytB domain-containing protein [Candidatus Omnitrophota bacterium]
MPDRISVCVLNDVDRIELSVRGGYKIMEISSGKIIDKAGTFFNKIITPVAGGIKFGDRIFSAKAICLVPQKQPAIYLNRRLYKGNLKIIRADARRLMAINEVGLEDYIKGVLYHEVSHRWPMEAIKAQAVVSRTYALYQIEENRHRHYHLHSDISSQVYNGVYAQRYRTNKAVDETKGMVLMWKNRPLAAFFHATCGGHTEKASRLWQMDEAPLAGVECGYCKNSPYYSWLYETDIQAFEEILKAKGYKVNGIRRVSTAGKDNNGRVGSIVIEANDITTTVTAKDLRSLIGPALIKSTNFNIFIDGDKLRVKGKGWGHGVGMCQWGAFSMAKKKKPFRDILSYYYPGAKIEALE